MPNASIVLSMIAALVCIAPLAVNAENMMASCPSTGGMFICPGIFLKPNPDRSGVLGIRKNTPGLPIQVGFLRLNGRWIPLKMLRTGRGQPCAKRSRCNCATGDLIGSPGHRLPSPSAPIRRVLPVVTLSATPESIQVGLPSTLAWSCRHADACTLQPEGRRTTGSIAILLIETTTYTLTASGDGGHGQREHHNCPDSTRCQPLKSPRHRIPSAPVALYRSLFAASQPQRCVIRTGYR